MRSARSERRIVRTAAALAGAVAVLLMLAACGGGGGGGSSSNGTTTTGGANQTVAVQNGGSITFALDEDLAGFNVLNASQNEFVLAEVMDSVWPNVFITPPSLKPVPDPNVVTSVKLTKTSPQTVVYKINPKAKWSDGVPISAADFIYNWQAQSGSSKYTDKGGKPFEPATTSGPKFGWK